MRRSFVGKSHCQWLFRWRHRLLNSWRQQYICLHRVAIDKGVRHCRLQKWILSASFLCWNQVFRRNVPRSTEILQNQPLKIKRFFRALPLLAIFVCHHRIIGGMDVEAVNGTTIVVTQRHPQTQKPPWMIHLHIIITIIIVIMEMRTINKVRNIIEITWFEHWSQSNRKRGFLFRHSFNTHLTTTSIYVSLVQRIRWSLVCFLSLVHSYSTTEIEKS
jgi:hypothetical protein